MTGVETFDSVRKVDFVLGLGMIEENLPNWSNQKEKGCVSDTWGR